MPKFFAFAILTTLMMPRAFAVHVPETYRSGKEICLTAKPAQEFGHWVQVPVNYNDTRSGFTDIHYWTTKPYDQNKQTMIFISGGPGDTAHRSKLDLPDWNVVFFDQRGNSCSRPPLRENYLDQEFYSSKNTAKDIEEIRKALAAKKISVYGVSYGTVPAHLYGHLFPKSTRAIVLEGVVYQGGSHFMSPLRRLKLLQKFFDGLPQNMQDQILRLSSIPEMPTNWFSNIGMKMLYLDHSFVSFRTFLDNILWSSDVLTSLANSWQEQRPIDVEFGYSHVLMGMIGCRELGMNLSTASLYAVFEGRKLVYDRKNALQEHYCEPLGFKKDISENLFKASHHPSMAPITYFQGTFDGATVASEAIQHYRTAARGLAQLVLVGRGGHLPVSGGLSSLYESEELIKLKQEALNHALQGKELPLQLLRILETATGLTWRRSLKTTSEQKTEASPSF